MRYQEPLFRPPSEARSLILQATLGCSHNACTYCAMYRSRRYALRPLDEVLEDLRWAGAHYGRAATKLFVADGDPLAMPMAHWEPLLRTAREVLPGLRRVSTYATAMNLLEKTPEELARLRELGLSLLYIGPESGDDTTLRRIAKGADQAQHMAAAQRAHAAGLRLSAIFLLGCAGTERSAEHAEGSARLATAMDPAFLSALTVTVVPGTPLARLQARGDFVLPDVPGLLRELRTFVAGVGTTDAVFRTNHASNYLPLAGRLAADRERILGTLDAALDGRIPLRPEWLRGL
ncbi:MAG: radical SAM protein [Pseudomonadota bacterium]